MPVHRGRALALLCVAQFVDVLGVTVVVVALPSITRDLGGGSAQGQWVVTAYAVCFGGFLLAAGRAADLLGRRRVFAAGLALFAAASLAGGLAGSLGMLVAARAVQGFAAALIVPAALALLMTIFPAGSVRHRALGVWTAAAAGGGALGFLIGGLITDGLGWEWVFLVNVPVGLTALALTPLVLPPAPPQRGGALVPWRALRSRTLLGANLTAFVLTATTSAAAVLTTTWAQQERDLSPAATGLVLSPFSVAVIAGSLAGPRLLRAVGTRALAAAGLLAVAGALVVAMRLSLGFIVAYLALAGLALGAASVASTSAGTAAAPAGDQGLASGLLNTAAQIGTALGVATLVALADAHGLRAGFAAGAALALAGAATAPAFLPR